MTWWIDLTVDGQEYRLTGEARDEFARTLQRLRLRSLREDTRELRQRAEELRRRLRRLDARDRRERQLAGDVEDTPEIANGDHDAVPRTPMYARDDGDGRWLGR